MDKAVLHSILGNHKSALELIEPPTNAKNISWEKGIISAHILLNSGQAEGAIKVLDNTTQDTDY